MISNRNNICIVSYTRKARIIHKISILRKNWQGIQTMQIMLLAITKTQIQIIIAVGILLTTRTRLKLFKYYHIMETYRQSL